MKLSRKVGKLAAGETYARAGRKIRRALAPIRLQPLLDKIDQQRLRDIQERYRASPESYAKYAQVERWLKRHVKKIQHLRLHRSSPREILDLGCGGGFFLFIAQQFGHSGIGLDLDEFPLFGELLALFGVPRKVWRIAPFQPLPEFDRKFDWITAFSTRFNRDREDRQVWGAKEWNFFLDHLKRHLRPGGKVFFEINSGKARSFYPNEVRELFQRRGAELERDYVYFPDGPL